MLILFRRRAIAASLADQVHLTGDGRDMEEPIRISKEIEGESSVKQKTSMSQEEQLAERSTNMKKRKAEEELQPAGSAKHLITEVPRPSISSSSSTSSSSRAKGILFL